MNPALGLAAARVAIGGVALAAPELGTKLFRLDPAANPQLPYMTRLFGSREIVLGAATLLASGKTRRNLVLAGIAVDAADAAAAWLAGEARRGRPEDDVRPGRTCGGGRAGRRGRSAACSLTDHSTPPERVIPGGAAELLPWSPRLSGAVT